MKKILALLLALVMVFALAACAPTPGPDDGGDNPPVNTDPIKIGCIQDLSGTASEPGQANAWGAEYAIKLLNDAGGINGRKIEFISLDCKNDVQEAINCYRKLIDEHKVDAIVGPPLSNPAISIAPLTEEDEVPIVGHFMDERATTNADTGKAWSYMFLAEPSCAQQSYSIADYALKKLSLKTFSVLYDEGNAFAVKHAEPFLQYVKDNGGTVVEPQTYQSADKDFRAQATKIAAANPDAVFVCNYAQGNALCYDQLREAGYKGVILGANTFQAPFTTLIKTPLENVKFLYNIDLNNDFTKKVMDVYTTQNNTYAKVNVCFGYDAVQVIADAMKRAKDPTDSKELKGLIETCKDVATSSGPITINADTHRTVGMPMYIVEYDKDLKITVVDKITLDPSWDKK